MQIDQQNEISLSPLLFYFFSSAVYSNLFEAFNSTVRSLFRHLLFI